MKRSRREFILGTVLLVLFLIQDVAHWKITAFESLQTNGTYRIVSGLILAGFVLFQWYLSFLRMRGRTASAAKHYDLHQKVGIWAPLVFYIHSTRFGFAYLFFLSAVYFSNVLLGLFNAETLHYRKKWFTFSWMVAHVSLSVLLVVVMIYHLWVVVYYH